MGSILDRGGMWEDQRDGPDWSTRPPTPPSCGVAPGKLSANIMTALLRADPLGKDQGIASTASGLVIGEAATSLKEAPKPGFFFLPSYAVVGRWLEVKVALTNSKTELALIGEPFSTGGGYTISYNILLLSKDRVIHRSPASLDAHVFAVFAAAISLALAAFFDLIFS